MSGGTTVPVAGIDRLPLPVPVDPAPTRLLIRAERPIAGWSVRLTWRSRVAVVERLDGGTSAPFLAPPHHDARALESGSLRLVGVQVGALRPVGELHVATIRWKAVTVGDAELTVRLESAVDSDGRPVAADLEAEPAELRVELGAAPVESSRED